MITVLIENLEFKTIIGMLEFERTKAQKIKINAKFQAHEFIDYALVCEILENEFNKNKFVKVEDALNYFCDFFKKKYPTINYFFMKIIKKEILQNADVGAMIEEIF
ncbi:dihydroneopterin aldolase [Campylobacter ureolyticus]|uniref:dihydroneopterin aldolase n=1 Tax=Campylobacter ureolyticus TaxID=827 RepID=UPI0022B47CBE|nr:dihydroneopterin aldolase [Campylobacter ureolyticus]MCZ6172626.1 dihydroneopterin aldolase [Campylobacter ureolyticus]